MTLRILGIDPGTRIAGYGVVDLHPDGRITGVSAGVWRFDADLPLAARLASLATEFARVVGIYSPQGVCVEQAFVAQNIRSALFLGHARGVVLAHAHQSGLAVHELSPTAVKKAVLAHGRSSKESIAHALSQILKVSFENLPHDASDALAVAYAHALKEKMARTQGVSLSQEGQMEKKTKRRAGGSRWASPETPRHSNSVRKKNGFEMFVEGDKKLRKL
ncbi:MAG: crossover junction endodeoxyribonuclease RuvC [Silvanigrellaceae bacterium]